MRLETCQKSSSPVQGGILNQSAGGDGRAVLLNRLPSPAWSWGANLLSYPLTYPDLYCASPYRVVHPERSPNNGAIQYLQVPDPLGIG